MNERELLAAHCDLARDVECFVLACIYDRERSYRLAAAAQRESRHSGLHVPAWLQPRLERYADSIGYPVGYAPLVNGNASTLGVTQVDLGDDDMLHGSITLRSDLSPASRARVTCHELAHAQAHPGLLMKSMAAALRGEAQPNPGEGEETIAETCAALTTRALGIGWGEFSLSYLAGSTSGRREELAEARDEAVRRAGVILKAIA